MQKILSKLWTNEDGVIGSEVDWDIDLLFDRKIRQCNHCGTIFTEGQDNICPSCAKDIGESSGFFRDPVEWTEKFITAFDIVEKEVDRLIPEETRGFGSCHRIWNTERDLLLQHGIDWKTPSKMNPLIRFD